MAKSNSCIPYVEAFVDSTRPENQQAANVDAIAALVKSDQLTLEALVKEMELYLTTSDHFIRGRGILLLAEILNRLTLKPLGRTTISSLIMFFTSRLADWQALRGALLGCLALLRRKSNVGVAVVSEAKALAESFLENVQVQSLAVHDRKLCFEVLHCLLDAYPKAVKALGDDLVLGFCQAIDGEKDPRCLMLTFHLVELLVRLFPEPSGSVASVANDLFEILGCYFPVYFTHPRSDDFEIKRDDLSKALMNAFCSTPFFEPVSIPLLLDKLSSSLPLAKLDSLKCLNKCILCYGADRMVKHAKVIWSALKDAIFNLSPQGTIFLPPSESAADLVSEENQIAKEVLTCLQTAISKLTLSTGDSFIGLILDDQDIDMYFASVSAEINYSGISEESQHQLSTVGSILSIASKVSTDCCSRVFEKFFTRLMSILGVSVSSASNGRITDNKVSSKVLNFRALYLCVELLASCRDLAVAERDSSPQVQDSWRYLLGDFSGQLTYVFKSALVNSDSDVVMNGNSKLKHVHYAVKGLQALATFPEYDSPIPEDIYEDILAFLMSVITDRSDDIFLWRLSLKTLSQIGLFIEKFNDSKKGLSYKKIVVERIVSLLSTDDRTVPLALTLEAVSEIGITGLDYMAIVIQGLEEAVFSNFSKACADGNSGTADVLVALLECYSSHVLPWCFQHGKIEEVALQFAVNIWNLMENSISFGIDLQRKDLLDMAMMTMKLIVRDCTEEAQSLVVQKAYNILTSMTSPLLSLLFTSKLEALQLIPDISSLSCKDEWLVSLFASVVIALRPKTPLPDARMLIKLFMVLILKGHVPAAQAVASLINKWPGDISNTNVPSAYRMEEAVHMILESLSAVLYCIPSEGNRFPISEDNLSCSWPIPLQIHAMNGLAWVGKGLLMRGHESVKEVTILLLKCFLSSQRTMIMPLNQDESGNGNGQDMHSLLTRSAADAFHVFLCDSEICLNKRFHATIRPLYKQRFFSTMMPVLLSSIKESNSSRSILYLAFGHVISGTPLVALVAEAKKVIPPLLDGLSVLSLDIINKQMTYSLLLVLSGILMDENGTEAIMENAHIIITQLIRLISYPHMMLVRETAIQCLVAMSALPHTRIYPMRRQVLRALSKSLDDRKRAVRLEAVRCRQAWASIASRSLHF